MLRYKLVIKDMKYVQPGEIRMNFLNMSETTNSSDEEQINVHYLQPKDQDNVHFSIEKYHANLVVSNFSKIVMFGDVVTSTQSFLSRNIGFTKSLPSGFIFVANQQSNGHGRRSNQWLSPLGCLMFSFVLNHTDVKTLSLVQHIMSIAIVHSIRSLHSDLEVNIKWPNDIYVNKKTKIGGIIVGANYFDSTYVLIIGCGLNVDNQEPTICLNQFIEEYNKTTGNIIEKVSKEVLLGKIMTNFELFYLELCRDGWSKNLETHYYKYWLHQNQLVTIQGNKEIRLTGIDEFGYLIGFDELGAKYTLEPDGTSFDMLNNLIIQKK
jgi:biotin--protein ligase